MCSGNEWRELDGPANVGEMDAVAFSCAACGFLRTHRRDL
jgi:hypothetical protein